MARHDLHSTSACARFVRNVEIALGGSRQSIMLAALAHATICSHALVGTTCKLSLNIGREKGTWMPADWAASGARLSLSFDVCFEESELEHFGEYERWLQRLPAESRFARGFNRRRLTSLSQPKYIDGDGEQTVALSNLAAWVTGGEKDGKQALRFIVDFSDGAKRQDVSIEPERLYFATEYWHAGVLDTLQQRHDDLLNEVDEVQQRRDKHTAEMDQANALTKLLMVRQGVVLYDEQILLSSRLAELKAELPNELGTADWPDGPSIWNGGTVCVKRKNALTNAGEEYHVIGTFSARPCS